MVLTMGVSILVNPVRKSHWKREGCSMEKTMVIALSATHSASRVINSESHLFYSVGQFSWKVPAWETERLPPGALQYPSRNFFPIHFLSNVHTNPWQEKSSFSEFLFGFIYVGEWKSKEGVIRFSLIKNITLLISFCLFSYFFPCDLHPLHHSLLFFLLCCAGKKGRCWSHFAFWSLSDINYKKDCIQL